MRRLAEFVLFVQFKNVKNTHGRVLLLVKLQAETGNFTKSNIPSWLFFTFFKLYTTYCTLTHYLFTYLLINNFRLTYLPSQSSTLVWKSCSNLRCCVQIKKDSSSNLANQLELINRFTGLQIIVFGYFNGTCLERSVLGLFPVRVAANYFFTLPLCIQLRSQKLCKGDTWIKY